MRVFDLPISWFELFKRTARETMDDDCLGLAAQMAYYFLLALFPAVLFFLAVASFFPLQDLTDEVTDVLQPFVSPQVLALITDQMRSLADADSGGILTVGVMGALWSSSAALVSILTSLNTAYDITERRPWWKVRLWAIGLTLVLAVFSLVSLWLIMMGPTVATYLGQTLGWGWAFEWAWKILEWPVAFALVTTALAAIYYIGPDADQDWLWVSPGAVLGTTLWILGSLAFKFYIARFGTYSETYGVVGVVIVLLLWFYLSGLAILIGGEMNSEIEHASPHGKNPGDRHAPRRPGPSHPEADARRDTRS